MAPLLATWNVNSIRVRLPHILRWAAATRPDILCLQETKSPDPDFPEQPLREAGFHSVFAGEKTYNGVAILSRERPDRVETGFPDDDSAAPKRLISAQFGAFRIVNVYVPNGSQVGSDKFAFKMSWLSKLAEYLAGRCQPDSPLVVCGDFNIAPEDRDVHAPDAMRESIMFSAQEHKALEGLLSLGLSDALRLHTDQAGLYSWWDYRAGAFRRNHGWRIDLILASRSAAQRCTRAWIDTEPRGWERPSDHAPALAEFAG